MTEKRIRIAKIATAHGIKGLIKLDFYGEDINIFKDGVTFYTSETEDKEIKIIVKNQIKNQWVAQVNDISDRNDAEPLRGTKIFMDASNMTKIDNDDEFYIQDLIGLIAIDADELEFGKILAIQDFGAGNLIEINPYDGSSFYLPFTKEYVPKINIKAGTVTIISDDAFLSE